MRFQNKESRSKAKSFQKLSDQVSNNLNIFYPPPLSSKNSRLPFLLTHLNSLSLLIR